MHVAFGRVRRKSYSGQIGVTNPSQKRKGTLNAKNFTHSLLVIGFRCALPIGVNLGFPYSRRLGRTALRRMSVFQTQVKSNRLPDTRKNRVMWRVWRKHRFSMIFTVLVASVLPNLRCAEAVFLKLTLMLKIKPLLYSHLRGENIRAED